jgi:hypothetical protein
MPCGLRALVGSAGCSDHHTGLVVTVTYDCDGSERAVWFDVRVGQSYSQQLARNMGNSQNYGVFRSWLAAGWRSYLRARSLGSVEIGLARRPVWNHVESLWNRCGIAVESLWNRTT